jgi:hypothetical protein
MTNKRCMLQSCRKKRNNVYQLHSNNIYQLYNSNMYKLQKLTLVGLGEAVLENEVTIIVNCYGVASPSQGCCKIYENEYNCLDITLEFRYWNYFLWRKQRLHIVYRQFTELHIVYRQFTELHIVYRQFNEFSSTTIWTILQQDNVGCLADM